VPKPFQVLASSLRKTQTRAITLNLFTGKDYRLLQHTLAALPDHLIFEAAFGSPKYNPKN